MFRRDTRPIDELMFEIFRVNDRLLAIGDATVKSVGLTSGRWLVLGAIALSDHPLPVAQIARNMGLSRQAVQKSTNEMAALGLVETRENPDRRRSKVIALTPAGRAAYEEALELWRSEWTGAMEEILTEEEILTAMRLLRRLRGLVQSGAHSSH
ncbi:MarR family winged helix-turn-helix transcriptional regulator [Agromyces salentinus]|uniref:HTH marR-type domain-containing protein n=1 Tax=Agromyces salentinus TaxID=269421 RepID=A0ABN2N0G8_9MICO|nr:MarR family transcriptional regulator [Agromyces salentinus]